MSVPDSIRQLVERFDEHRDSYRAGKYNETQLRREFLDPFFETLGWDVFNKQGYAEAYKDVIHEDSLEVEGATKAPDYSFRIGGTRKFFVEAKKPAVNIEYDIYPAFQLRRYAWSATLSLSVLTDFEEFAVYESRSKPDKSDSAATGRVLLLNYKDYLAKWDEIAAIFSREAVLKGSFDQYAEGLKGRKGIKEVDDAFLEEIEGWRDLLARNIAIRNPDLQVRELNYAVQMTIDRIVFLRICEDRGIEREGQLQELLEGDKVYERLCQLFRQADSRYNSGLFHFSEEKGQSSAPDGFTLRLAIDDKALKEILRDLYYPSPYVFRVIPTEILGQVYERFLGKVIRLTAGHQAKVEEKPEVRKAGGVYYTPTYIVDYIVKNTVGKLLEDKTPREAAGLKILDPACGSGSFLLGAYQYLLDWHIQWYSGHEPEKWAKGKTPAIYQAQGGDYRLTTSEKKRILLNNIHGVDIDAQAVEVTKLSLSLKVLEGESQESIGAQLGLFKERALPDLGKNIQCGNSLIGLDYFEGRMFPDEEERYRVNPFNWQAAFPQIYIAGGFDAVIGNPPWISLSGKFGAEIYPSQQIEYLIKRYHGNTYMPNMYEYFVAQGLNLVRDSGFFSFIVPDRLGFNRQFVELRRRILSEARIVSLLYKVPFPGITADTLVFVFQKGETTGSNLVRISEYNKQVLEQSQGDLLSRSYFLFGYFENVDTMSLVNKVQMANVKTLKEFCDSTSGFGGKSNLITETQINANQIQTFKGESIGRYEMRKTFWFDFNKKNITGRTTDPRKLGASPRILLRKTGERIIATYDDSRVFPEQSLYFLYNKKEPIDYKYLLGSLNSRLLTAYYQAISLTNKKSIAQVKKVDLDEIPIRTINFANPAEKAAHDKIVSLVERMLELHRRSARTPQEKEMIQREIESTDRAIDALVYELYGLTEDEVKIVERG
jgi:hypothetical protein